MMLLNDIFVSFLLKMIKCEKAHRFNVEVEKFPLSVAITRLNIPLQL